MVLQDRERELGISPRPRLSGVSMSLIHGVLAILVAAGGLTLSLVVGLGVRTGRLKRFALDRAILAALALTLIAAASGLAVLLTGHRPADALHFLYAAVALAVLPIVRLTGGVIGSRRTLAVGVGGLLLALLVVRLYQTG